MKKIFLSAFFVLFFFALNSVVYSQSINSHAQQNRPYLTTDQKGNPGVFNATNSALPGNASKSAALLQKLEGVKLQVCQRLSDNITKRSQGLVKRSSDIENIFDTHALAVENYYTGKLVPSGKTLSNYNTLVADIESQKNLVDVAVSRATSDAASFTCQSNNPFAQVEQFRSDMLSVIQALLGYKKSVVNLIVAVANLGGVGTVSTNATESGRPSFIPNPNSTASGSQR